ncbi:response regulator [Acaryochloris sp. 'Moss Beach']|uniref:response regulator n=1 Tax=Acaryochloris TaxID=155977 RepID=UPI001BB070A2|nr:MULTISPECIES: response regulator [Acaryochloris]QUY40449.1 response regulator [Acaryochloris marina S15]UJB69683.1 response regulator [Acaryochloris sp. 'Moss Beach']
MANSAIICVDDESVVLRSLRDQISKYFGDQHTCEIAESVEEAWEVIDELKEDDVEILIIISDWLMPGTKGDEFLIELNQKFPEIVTVLLSGQADQSAVDRIHQNMKLHAYVSKPWNEEDLMDVIKTGLSAFQE